METQSPKWQLNATDLTKIAKVFGWSMSSAAVGFVIMTIPQVAMPEKYAAVALVIIPLVNTVGVTIKKWIQGKIDKY